MLNIQQGPHELRFLCELFDLTSAFHDAANIVRTMRAMTSVPAVAAPRVRQIHLKTVEHLMYT